jgi:DNA helicase TIP49 (TBP-interacting protein)
MSDTTIIDKIEEMLNYEVSDEALETAAGIGEEAARRYTLYFCTALDLCPSP